MYYTQEVRPLHSVSENWCYIEFVLKQGEPLESVLIDISHELVDLFTFFSEESESMNTHMHSLLVFFSSFEVRDRQLFLAVEISFQLAGHSKVLDEKRMLVCVLKETELAIFKRKSESVFKELVRVDNSLFLYFVLKFILCGNMEG